MPLSFWVRDALQWLSGIVQGFLLENPSHLPGQLKHAAHADWGFILRAFSFLISKSVHISTFVTNDTVLFDLCIEWLYESL